MSNSMIFRGTGDLLQVPAASTNPADRETVAAGITLAGPFPASQEQKERMDMATTAQVVAAYISKTAATPTTDMRLSVADQEYRIRGVSPWPMATPIFWELLMELEK